MSYYDPRDDGERFRFIGLFTAIVFLLFILWSAVSCAEDVDAFSAKEVQSEILTAQGVIVSQLIGKGIGGRLAYDMVMKRCGWLTVDKVVEVINTPNFKKPSNHTELAWAVATVVEISCRPEST